MTNERMKQRMRLNSAMTQLVADYLRRSDELFDGTDMGQVYKAVIIHKPMPFILCFVF